MNRTKLTFLTMATVLVVSAAPAAIGMPSEGTIESNDAWLCEGDGFVPNHCLNINSQGKVLNLLVFDDRGPQESATTNPAADDWPCPHDSGDSGPFGTDPEGGDGTWWNYLYGSSDGQPLYVCHHSGQQ